MAPTGNALLVIELPESQCSVVARMAPTCITTILLPMRFVAVLCRSTHGSYKLRFNVELLQMGRSALS
jgi:hypothetical protein